MSTREPTRDFTPIKLGGALDQSVSPSIVGGNGLTACNNLIYRRFGAWGKRSGSSYVYAAVAPTNPPPTPPTPPPPFTPAPPTPPSPPNPPPGGPRNPVH